MMLRTGKRLNSGFSLMEVMVAVSILALGTVVIHQTFLRSATYIGRYAKELRASLWLHEQSWQVQEKKIYSEENDEAAAEGADGTVKVDMPGEKDLYRVLLSMEWPEGQGLSGLSKEIYVFKKDPIKS